MRQPTETVMRQHITFEGCIFEDIVSGDNATGDSSAVVKCRTRKTLSHLWGLCSETFGFLNK